jgi:tetratricopeptide (TPR) repeat protein
MLKKQFREAICCFTEAVAADDKDANSFFRRGQCFFCLKDTDKAISDFNRAILITEGNDQFYLWRGSAYAQLGRDELAIADFLRAFRLNPELIANYKRQIANQIVAQSTGQLTSQATAQSANQATTQSTNQATTQATNHATGQSADQLSEHPRANTVVLGNGASAAKDFAEAVRLSSRRLSGYFRPGSIYSGICIIDQDTSEKKVVYDVARAINKPQIKGSDFFVVQSARSDLDLRTRAIDAEPNDTEALFARALDYQTLKDIDHAVIDFTRLTELKPGEIKFWLARAFFFNSIGDTEKAKLDLSKAQELDLSLPAKIDFEQTVHDRSVKSEG